MMLSMFRKRATLAPFLAILVVVLVLAGSAVGSVPAAPSAHASTFSDVFGDADCSGGLDPIDSLVILVQLSGVADAPCGELADVQCDVDTDVTDALQILRFKGGLGVTHQSGCPAIGEPLGPTPNPLLVTVVLDPARAVTAKIA